MTPDVSQPFESIPTRARWSQLSLALSFIGCLVVVVLIYALLLPEITRGREASRLTHCRNHLKQIGVALNQYLEQYRAFPPAFTIDAKGNRLHSWRTLLLPFLGQESLYQSIDLSVPWDHPVNSNAAMTIVPAYVCPSAWTEGTRTTYVAIIGPNSSWPGATSRRPDDVSDRRHETLMILELSPDSAIPWMSPEDIRTEELLNLSPQTRWAHPSLSNALMMDMSVQRLSGDDFKGRLRGLITINGNDH